MLMGVISFYDVAKAVVDSQNFENRMLKAYIRDWPVESRDEPPRRRIELDAAAARAGAALGMIRAMSGSTFGTLFAVTNFGESHGPAIGCVIDGCPPGHGAVARPTSSPSSTGAAPAPRATSRSASEADKVEILSGVYEGQTTGTPICLLIRNTDQRSKDYGNIARHLPPRPRRLHLPAQVRPARPARRRPRLGAPDRADGRGRRGRHEVAARSSTARRFVGCMTQIGEIAIPFEGWEHVADNPFFAANASDIPQLEAYMDALRKAGDSLRRAHRRGRAAACRSAWASRCSTSSTPTSPTR